MLEYGPVDRGSSGSSGSSDRMTYIYVAVVTRAGRSYPTLLRGITTQLYHTQVSACSYDEARMLGVNWATQQGIGQRRKQVFSDYVIKIEE